MIIKTTSQMKLKSILGALVLLSSVPAFGENTPVSFEEKMVRAEQLISSDSSQAIAIFTEMAEKGYAPAQAYLGELYYWGTYHEPDYKKAHDWLEKAAKDKTQIHSMKLLAEMYTEGKGVPMDSAKAFEWYKKVADSEVYQSDGVLYVGQAYLNGTGVEKNLQQAVSYLAKSANHGDSEANRILGKLYEEGAEGIEKNDKLAFKHYAMVDKSTMFADNSDVVYRRAVMLEEGRGVEKSLGEAFSDYLNVFNFGSVELKQKAAARLTALFPDITRYAEAGDNSYKLMLGQMYEDGAGVKRSYLKAEQLYKAVYQNSERFEQEEAFLLLDHLRRKITDINRPAKRIEATEQDLIELKKAEGLREQNEHEKACYVLKPLAEKDIAQAQYELATHYLDGDCFAEEKEKSAFQLVSNAARQQHSDSQVLLAWMYQYGIGADEDWWLSAAWYNKAAEQGHIEATYRLAGFYTDGFGVGQNAEKALELYEKAIQGNHLEALNDLGMLYSSGALGEPDYTKAMEYYLKGAKQNDGLAMNNIGVLYQEGYGVEQDYLTAKTWFEKGADLQEPYAQYNLGLLYKNGRGVKKDQKHALALFEMAASLDNAEAAMEAATMYERGIGVKKDIKQARHYYAYVLAYGHTDLSHKADEAIKRIDKSASGKQ